ILGLSAFIHSCLFCVQLLRAFLLFLLPVHLCLASALGSQCDKETFCTYSLQDYYSQPVNLPSHINERSIATWSYVENIDLDRIPQVIHEASCHTSHSCGGIDNPVGLETIPVTLRMPVLKKNLKCFPLASYSLEFQLITVACICAISRHSLD
uniref:Interleukin 17N n=1 Tax=Kryptolebias marmoratus TaxID=37003 RepID=A0A3Q2ZJB9_KRYMA